MAYPTLVDSAIYESDAQVSTHNITLPSGITAGNLIVLLIRGREDVALPVSGWDTVFSTDAEACALARVADGSEGSTAAIPFVADGRCAAISLLYDDWTDIEGVDAAGTDPPNLAPSFGSGDNLWIVGVSSRRSDWTSTLPTNYTGELVAAVAAPSSSTGRTRITAGFRELAASSENPGAFGITGTTAGPFAFTIAIAGASAGPVDITPAATIVSAVSATAAVTATSELAGTATYVVAVSATAQITANLTVTPAPTVVTAVSGTADVTATSEVAPSSTVVAAVSATAQIATVVPVFAWAVIGGVTGTTAEIRGELVDPFTDPDLLVSTSSDLSGAVTVAGTNTTGDVWTFAATSLTADTAYYYGFEAGAAFGSFRTAPTAAKSFTICAASCWNEATADTTVFDAMALKNPAVWLPLGDYPYIDNTDTAETNYLTLWSAMNAVPAIRDLHANTVTAYTWSDHDYADNNSNGTEAARPYAQSAYRKIWPSYTLPGSDGEIYHTFVWGRVRVIMLDCFSERTADSATDNSSKTMLGASQLAWLLDVLDNATEPLIIINVSEPWIDDTGTYSWGRYTYERAIIAEAIHDNGLDDAVVFIHGDTHQLAWDDGTNNTAGADWPPGPPVFCFAPIDSSPSSRAGPYSGGEWNDDHTQYGQIDIDDTGGVITATFRGITVDGTDEIERFAVELTFGVPEVAPTGSVVTAVSGTAQVTATTEVAPVATVVSSVSGTAQVTATTELAPTGSVVTAVSATASVTAALTITPAATVVTSVSGTAGITATTEITGTPTVVVPASATATVTATTELAPTGTVVLTFTGTANVGEGVIVYPTVIAPTWREPSHATVWREPSHATTYRERSHAATYRET